MKQPLIYKPAPTFGLDVGSHTVKLVQLAGSAKQPHMVGYGYAPFPPDSIVEGIISDPELVANAIKQVIAQPKGGKISARRTVLSVPASKVFTRTLVLPPKMSNEELGQAVSYEAEQYVPVPINDLYLDFEKVTNRSDDKDVSVLVVAAPRAIIDSYIKLFDFLDVEVDAIETGLSAITRAMISANHPDQAALVVDFGTAAADVAIYENGMRITGTFNAGGDDLTQTLVKQLGITTEQANEIKYKFGLKSSGLQPKILEALKPQLSTVTSEIKKILKYYQDRGESKTKIETMILTGGTSAMPGLIDYLYKELGVPAIIGDPWLGLNSKYVGTVNKLEAPMYTTAIGLAQRGLLK